MTMTATDTRDTRENAVDHNTSNMLMAFQSKKEEKGALVQG